MPIVILLMLTKGVIKLTLSEMNVLMKSDSTLNVAVLVYPRSSMMAVASALDPMRAANRISGRSLFSWKLVTYNNLAARLTCGVDLYPDEDISRLNEGDLLIVISGFKPDVYGSAENRRRLKELVVNYKMLCAVDSAPWILARCGLLESRQVTTHWEDIDEFTHQFPKVNVKRDRFVIDGNIVTCGGASPTLDFMLELIQIRYGLPLSMDVAGVFIYSSDLKSTNPQHQISLEKIGGVEPRVARAIQIMEDSIEDLLSLEEIAAKVSLSTRQLENIFSNTLNTTPGAYYRHLRLLSAHRLVLDTGLNMREITVRTGFSSLSAFSRAFKKQYGVSPKQLRQTRMTQ